jgi:hypothetical protein
MGLRSAPIQRATVLNATTQSQATSTENLILSVHDLEESKALPPPKSETLIRQSRGDIGFFICVLPDRFN